jgi:hypothetical protein
MPGKPSTGKKFVSLIGVDRKRFQRSRVTKSFSYRYEVGRSVGPPGDPLVEAGSAIVSSRYCGRAASWNFSRGVLSTERYVVNATFLSPSPDNPMTYPPRPPRGPEPEAVDTSSTVPLPRVPIVPPYLPPPPEPEAELWNDRPRRADPAPPPEKPRPQPGAHMHEPPPRFRR